MNSYRTYELKNNVRAVRVAYGLTQVELARLIGTTRNTISSIERCEWIPTAYLAALLCEKLKVPFEKLFFYEYEGVKAELHTELQTSVHDHIKQLRKELDWIYEFEDFDEEELFKITTDSPFI